MHLRHLSAVTIWWGNVTISLAYYQPLGPAALMGLIVAAIMYGYLVIAQDEESATMLLGSGIIYLIMQSIFIYVLG